MRFVWVLMLLLTAAANLWAQREPCLTGIDSPGCGIKLTLNPPQKPPDENTVWVPNEVTIEVPLRLRPTKIQVNSVPTEAQGTEQFKLFAETTHYKKADGSARFQIQIKNCPEPNEGFVFNILSPRMPYPLVVNAKPFECKQGTAQ